MGRWFLESSWIFLGRRCFRVIRVLDFWQNHGFLESWVSEICPQMWYDVTQYCISRFASNTELSHWTLITLYHCRFVAFESALHGFSLIQSTINLYLAADSQLITRWRSYGGGLEAVSAITLAALEVRWGAFDASLMTPRSHKISKSLERWKPASSLPCFVS